LCEFIKALYDRIDHSGAHFRTALPSLGQRADAWHRRLKCTGCNVAALKQIDKSRWYACVENVGLMAGFGYDGLQCAGDMNSPLDG
jgi:hypothetical protein